MVSAQFLRLFVVLCASLKEGEEISISDYSH